MLKQQNHTIISNYYLNLTIIHFDYPVQQVATNYCSFKYKPTHLQLHLIVWDLIPNFHLFGHTKIHQLEHLGGRYYLAKVEIYRWYNHILPCIDLFHYLIPRSYNLLNCVIVPDFLLLIELYAIRDSITLYQQLEYLYIIFDLLNCSIQLVLVVYL